MNLQFEKREWLLMAGSIILGVCILAGVYFLLYNPVQKEIDVRAQELETEEKLISILEEKTSNIEQETFENSISLQKKVPVKPMTEKLLLDLEKAETISDSFISSIQFSEGDVILPLTSQNAEEDIENLSSDESEDSGEANEQTQEILPQGLKKLNAILSVESPSYFEMEKFLEVLEELDRITEIEQIAFEGPEESIIQGDSYDKVSYKLLVAAFYLPDLMQLIEEMPSLNSPPPANKVNPFSSYSDLDENDDE